MSNNITVAIAERVLSAESSSVEEGSSAAAGSVRENLEWIERVEPFASAALEKLDIDRWELSILFCGDEFIAGLNRQYRQIGKPTDILSFEQGDEYIDEDGITWFTAGDLVISVPALQRNAVNFEVSEDEELKRLLIHGILHLKGFDHSDNSPEQEMLVLQEQVLSAMRDLPPIIVK